MRRAHLLIMVCMAFLLTAAALQAQQTNTRPTGREVTANRLITFNGVNGATADTSVGIGTTAPYSTSRLHVQSSFSSPSAGGRSVASNTYFSPSANKSGFVYGVESGAYYTGSLSLTRSHLGTNYALGALMGYYGGTVATGSTGGSVATVTGIAAQNLVRSGITVTDAIGVQIQPALADVGSATVSNVYGVYVKNPVNVTPSNVYGLYTEYLLSGTNNYGVYVSGGSKSYFGGNVGIGTTSPAERLHVIGNIRASGSITAFLGPETEVPDYVFESGYRLIPIDELRRFIAKEKHLPNVPKASEIKEKGLNLSEFQMKLLEKIEELTLYAVQQASTIKDQQKTIAEHKTALDYKDAAMANLNSRLIALEQVVERLAKNEGREQK